MTTTHDQVLDRVWHELDLQRRQLHVLERTTVDLSWNLRCVEKEISQVTKRLEKPQEAERKTTDLRTLLDQWWVKLALILLLSALNFKAEQMTKVLTFILR